VYLAFSSAAGIHWPIVPGDVLRELCKDCTDSGQGIYGPQVIIRIGFHLLVTLIFHPGLGPLLEEDFFRIELVVKVIKVTSERLLSCIPSSLR
jgi:hypothetical protein